MQLRMLSTMAGPDGVRHAGAIHEFDEATAEALVKGGFATDKLRPQKATQKKGETAAGAPQR